MRFVNKLRSLFRSSEVSLLDKVIYLRHKVGLGLLRGLLLLPFLRRGSGLPILGRRVRIAHAHHLQLGRGVYIGDDTVLFCLSRKGVTIGDGVTIREHGWMQITSDLNNLGDSVMIGDHTYIGPRSILGAAAPLVIGAGCQIGADVHFIAEQHNFVHGDKPIADQGVHRQGIVIGDGCWIGNGVRVLDGVTVGSGCVIGAGAVVTKDLPPMSVAVGVPARVIGHRGESVPSLPDNA